MNDLPTTPPPANFTPPPADPTNWRLYLELLTLCIVALPGIGHILGPLILWLVKKDTNPIVDAEGKKVLNFNISWTIWAIVTCGIGGLVWFVIQIVAIIKAANNEPFKHPLTIDFLK